MLRLNRVNFHYEDGRHVIKDLDLHIQAGELVLITGPSGCGKTTLTKIMNGLIPKYYQGHLSGEISLLGKAIADYPVGGLGKLIGNVFQNPKSQFLCDRVEDEIALIGENFAMPPAQLKQRVHAACAALKIEHLLAQKVSHLSSGEKQKVALASSLVYDNPLIILDEPSANLDLKSAIELGHCLQQLKQRGKSIVVSEHRLFFLKDYIDRLIVMQDGKICQQYHRHELATLDTQALGLRPLHYQHYLAQQQPKNSQEIVLCENFNLQNTQKVLLPQLNLQLQQGEVVAILGKNGIGKSTFAKQLSGLLPVKTGKLGTGETAKQRLMNSYYVMQDSDAQLFFDTIEKEFLLGSTTAAAREYAKYLLQQLDLWEMRTKLPQMRSGGEKQRICIGAACMSNSPFIVLDEPSSGLDYGRMLRIKAILHEKAQHATILMISHDYEFILAACHRAILLTPQGAELMTVAGHEQQIFAFLATGQTV
ncbi:ABC transporter ATP-binding protein [Acinetobacter larvae]|uniref:ABC transporter domain-containing protein n=1 Tax=Acinetobacter larvae TaxID=1789224 RepID=A0A1B2LY85_9GAMM|nr:ABC transporter ATP-binding protein [Acinetobacter larvae]AOA57922.1 hypothetical protein BFG52_05860 [Acinetobacter larvae]